MTSARELFTLLVLGGGIWALIQFTGLKFWQAALVFAAGFYLATTAAGPHLTRFFAGIPALFGH